MSTRRTPPVLTFLALLAPVGLAVVAGCTRTAAEASEPTPDQVKASTTERFSDLNAALAAGYIPDPSGMCVTSEMIGMPGAGAMGVHYLRPDLLGVSQAANGRVTGTSTYTDFNDPAILLYEPQEDGSMKLVGVENLVFQSAWEAAGHTDLPTYRGEPYEHMVDDPSTPIDEAHGFEPHYDLHVWLQRPNPKGMFVPFNPDVSCQYGQTMPPAQSAAAPPKS